MLRRRLAGSIVIVLMSVAGCSSDESTSTADTSAAQSSAADTTAPPPDGATGNDADIRFARAMIPHHEQAIDMAELALDPARGAGAEVLDLATRIRDAQGPEVALLTEWLTVQGESVDADAGHEHDMGGAEGMMSADELDSLGALDAVAFDTAWIELMIEHHEGAVSMATTLQADGSSPEMLALADEIIAAQQAEIAEMQALLDA